MALFDTTPQDTESVKLGARRIRDVKTLLNATLGLIFSDGVPTWIANIIPGASLVTASVTGTQLAAATVTAANIAPGAVTAASLVADAYAYAPGVLTGSNYVATLAPVPPILNPGTEVSFQADKANPGATGLAINGLGTTLLYIVTNRVQAAIPVTSITFSGTTATVTTTSAHGLSAFTDHVSIRGASDANYNVTEATILSITTSTPFTFTYAMPGTPSAPATVIAVPTVKKFGSLDLVAGDIAALQIVSAVFDGTFFQMTSATATTVDKTSAGAVAARAWVKFDGTKSQTLNLSTAPTLTYNTSTHVFTATATPAPVLTAGQGVGIYTSGTFPGGLADSRTAFYYAGSISIGAGSTTFLLYDTVAHAIAGSSTVGVLGNGTANTTTTYLMYAPIKTSFNIAAVVPALNVRAGGINFNSYEIWFTTPPSTADYATVGSGKPGANSYNCFVNTDENDAGLTAHKRIDTLAGYVVDGLTYTSGLPETNLVFFWN